MNVFEHNRRAWNRSAARRERWTRAVSSAEVDAARCGDVSILLTPNRRVPAEWLGSLSGQRILCLAGGGGQQAPLLAAAGAHVVSLDASEAQLARDREVAERDGLQLETVPGDMADLSPFESGHFDRIVHPISNVFVPDPLPVWRECFRVLRPGGELLAGVMNPVFYMFHEEHTEDGRPIVQHALPYNDLDHMPADAFAAHVQAEEPVEYSHSLQTLLGGQMVAGFALIGLFEDDWDDEATRLNRWMPTSMATRALKPA